MKRISGEAQTGIGIAAVGGIVLAIVWYWVLTPLLLAPTADQVVEAFKEEGLEVGTYYPLEDEENGLAPIPKTYKEATRFTIPSLKEAEEAKYKAENAKLLGPDGRPVPESEWPPNPPVEDQGGRVFTFNNKHDLETVRNYYENGIPHMLGLAPPHLYEEGLVLLEINEELPKDQAEEYGAVLKKVA
jgi:hypothetical protein